MSWSLLIYKYAQASQITKLSIVSILMPIIILQEFGVEYIGWSRIIFMVGKLCSCFFVSDYFKHGNFRRNCIIAAWGRTLPWLLLFIPIGDYKLYALLFASFLDGVFCSLDILCQVDNCGLDYMSKDFGVTITQDERVKALSFYSMYISTSFLVVTGTLSGLIIYIPYITTSVNYKYAILIICCISSVTSSILYCFMGKIREPPVSTHCSHKTISHIDAVKITFKTPTIIWRVIMNVVEVGWTELACLFLMSRG
jgi:hypothetical protein